ncbi:MAG: DUF192 domain-containing protein [Oscillospiraceae bacterium]|nr:DUF192 domain-containing protein [Oscillospiraceae bacterium]
MKVTCGGRTLAADVRTADDFFSRFLGLMGRRELPPGGGLLLRRCASIHCFFMCFTIDAVYLDGDMRVVGTETLAPWRVGHIFRGVRHVLELPAGAAAGLSAGDTLHTEI